MALTHAGAKPPRTDTQRSYGKRLFQGRQRGQKRLRLAITRVSHRSLDQRPDGALRLRDESQTRLAQFDAPDPPVVRRLHGSHQPRHLELAQHACDTRLTEPYGRREITDIRGPESLQGGE